MADPHRDNLALSAALVGGACVTVFMVIVGTMLLSPAVPRPRNLGDARLQEAIAVSPPAPPSRDNDRIVSAPSDMPGDNRGTSLPPATAMPAAQDSSGTKIASTIMPAPADMSTGSVATSTALPGNFPTGGNASVKSPARDADGQRGLVILQIGDSHTSADFFSGEVRRLLQQRYGNGGVGYLTAGKPHIGVRSSTMKVAISPGWTYHAIQHSDNISEFWLSGFNAIASAPGETLTFTSDNPVPFDSIEIEAMRQPGGGAVDISLDGIVKNSVDLDGKAEPLVVRLRPDGAPSDHVRQVEIRTRKEGTVSIASVAIYNRQSGVSYNNIGYPGATIDLLNKFDGTLMSDDLRRLDPQIVVISFGTNEASKPNLDPVRYQQNYEKVIDKITAALPRAKIVLIGPPDGEERSSHCRGKPAQDIVCRPAADATPGSANSASSKPGDCEWQTLPKLEMVRTVERKIAERHGFMYWNWASIMPHDCGAHLWTTASPPLMAPDHVHFTIAGYNKGAEQFVDATLIPMIEKLQVRPNIAANN